MLAQPYTFNLLLSSGGSISSMYHRERSGDALSRYQIDDVDVWRYLDVESSQATFIMV